MRRFRAAVVAVALAISGPAAAETVVRWMRGDGVPTFDPHGAFTLPSFNGYRQVYEALVLHDRRSTWCRAS